MAICLTSGAIYLTPGAIEELSNGNVKSEQQMLPVLHVLRSSLTSDVPPKAVLSLTDFQGQEIEAILNNGRLVRNGLIVPGSIIQLLEFTTKVTQIYPFRRYVVITQVYGISSHSDLVRQPEYFVPNTPEGGDDADDVKLVVEEELKIFRKRIKDAKAFISNTRNTKSGIQATVRCFDMLITHFNTVLWRLRVPLEEQPSARPSNDDSDNLGKNQLRSNASSLYKFFMKYSAPPLLKLFRSTTKLTVLNEIHSVVDECSTTVYRVTRDGYDCKREEDEDFEWFP